MDYFFEEKPDSISIQLNDTLDYRAHLHDHVELVYVISGSSDLFLEDKMYHVQQGDFLIIFPNQIHRYENSNNANAYVMIFSPDFIPEFRSIFSKKLPICPVVDGDTKNATKLAKLFFSEYHSLSVEITRGFTLALTGMLLKNMEFADFDKYNISTLKNILIYCNEHYTEPISADSVASALHISRSHIAHVFKSKLNTTFGNYICSKRISYACNLLKNTTLSVTESAFASGFDSVRTFNRIFIKHTGVTPREYRKQST